MLGTTTYVDTLGRLIERRTSPSGWFGLKAHWLQFEAALQEMDIESVLPIDAVIRIGRTDAVLQAVSLAIAMQSGAWISYHQASGSPTYDFDTIRRAHLRLTAESAAWDRYLSSKALTPLHIEYEHLVAMPEATVQSVRDHLGIGPAILSRRPGPTRQATALNEVWRSRYLADLERVERSEA